MAENAREWLLNNGFAAEAKKIETILERWRERGIKTRRNWWSVIAGTISGNSVNVDGIDFLVIKEARERMHLPPSKSAVASKKGSEAPPIYNQVRWKGVKKKSKK